MANALLLKKKLRTRFIKLPLKQIVKIFESKVGSPSSGQFKTVILYLDVYYSGILRKKAGIPLDDEDRLSEMHCTYLDEELYRWKYKNLMKTKNLTLLYHESTY